MPKQEAPAPITQGNQIRFVANHPQLALLTTAVAKGTESITVELPAKLIWNEDRTQRIYAAFSGRVASIRADIGQNVTAGQTLAILSSPDFAQAQADASAAATNLRQTERAMARQKELLALGVTARKDFESAEADAARAAAENDRAAARVRLYGASNAVAELALAARVSGIVVERNLNPGQELRPDQSGVGVPPLYVVSDPSQLWVQIDAKEADAAGLKAGQTFDLVVPALNNRTIKAQIKAVADFIDPTTRTIKVRGLVDNKDRQLKAEMLGTARLVRPMPKASVVIPATAALLTGAKHFVFVQTSTGVFEPREVELAFEGGQEIVVSKGLADSEQVVAQNTLLLARLWRTSREALPGALSREATPAVTSGASSPSAPTGNMTQGKQ